MTGYNPLRAYLHRDGFARFCTAKCAPPRAARARRALGDIPAPPRPHPGHGWRSRRRYSPSPQLLIYSLVRKYTDPRSCGRACPLFASQVKIDRIGIRLALSSRRRYSSSPADLDNVLMHLTNVAVQARPRPPRHRPRNKCYYYYLLF